MILLLVCAFALLLGAPTASAQLADELLPSPGTLDAKNLQAALNRAGCYPPGTPERSRTDGLFGAPNTNTYSRQAIDNWLSAKGSSGSGYSSPQQFTSDVLTSGSICPTESTQACRKDTIGGKYLSRLTGVDEVRRLAVALQSAITNFDTPETSGQSAVFPAGRGDPVTLSGQNQDRVREFGVEGVTPSTTLTSLRSALYNFDNLVLSYALEAPECRNCAKINDWLYLRNIASTNAGILISKSPTQDIFVYFNVNDITEDMMDEVRPNIYVFRSITAKLHKILAAGADPAETRSHLGQRDAELYGIVSYFSAKTASSKARKMSALAAASKCIGFTGSAIYQ